MLEAYEHLSTLLNLPIVKALSLLASLIGAAAGLLSLRRVNQVSDAQLANFQADHARHIHEQRSRIDLATLQSPETAALVARSFGRKDADEARREALHCLYLNLLASAHSAWRNDLISRQDFDRHMDFFFDDYKGSLSELEALLTANYYTADFDRECRARLQRPRTNQPAPFQYPAR